MPLASRLPPSPPHLAAWKRGARLGNAASLMVSPWSFFWGPVTLFRKKKKTDKAHGIAPSVVMGAAEDLALISVSQSDRSQCVGTESRRDCGALCRELALTSLLL